MSLNVITLATERNTKPLKRRHLKKGLLLPCYPSVSSRGVRGGQMWHLREPIRHCNRPDLSVNMQICRRARGQRSTVYLMAGNLTATSKKYMKSTMKTPNMLSFHSDVNTVFLLLCPSMPRQRCSHDVVNMTKAWQSQSSPQKKLWFVGYVMTCSHLCISVSVSYCQKSL